MKSLKKSCLLIFFYTFFSLCELYFLICQTNNNLFSLCSVWPYWNCWHFSDCHYKHVFLIRIPLNVVGFHKGELNKWWNIKLTLIIWNLHAYLRENLIHFEDLAFCSKRIPINPGLNQIQFGPSWSKISSFVSSLSSVIPKSYFLS